MVFLKKEIFKYFFFQIVISFCFNLMRSEGVMMLFLLNTYMFVNQLGDSEPGYNDPLSIMRFSFKRVQLVQKIDRG